MKNILAGCLIALVAFFATPVRASDDFNSNNIPDTHYLSWGANKSTLIYGNDVSKYFRIWVNGADHTAFTSTGVGIFNTSPTVALDVTGAAKVSSTLAVTGAITSAASIAVSTAAVGATPITISGGYTSTQISTLTGVSGALIFNASSLNVCVGTGPTSGAWVYISSYTTATSGVRVPCL